MKKKQGVWDSLLENHREKLEWAMIVAVALFFLSLVTMVLVAIWWKAI